MKNKSEAYLYLRKYSVKTVLLLCLVLVVIFVEANAIKEQRDPERKKASKTSMGDNERWSKEKVNTWYDAQQWPVGCNYVTSTAINQIEMWQEDTFDPKTIDKELGFAENIGFNTVRIFLHDLVWEANPESFKKRLSTFFDIAEKHDIRVIVTFFTNGTYHASSSPHLGKQKDPIPGVHNSGWVQSPAAENVNNPSNWGRLESYIKDIVGCFRNDNRILMWCLYNEPENAKRGAQSLSLMRQVYKWARSVNPSQPLTAPIWSLPCESKSNVEIVSFLGENCDVISFHSYRDGETMEEFIELLKVFDRPLICTEYMARTTGSTFEAILPILKRENVGAISFGLVAGKGNFFYPWGSQEGSAEPEVWFHDIFRANGTPYDQGEIELIKQITETSH